MITFTKAYVANGKTFATIEEAQRAEIEMLFCPTDDPWTPARMAIAIVANAESIIDILTTTESSRPLARKSNGGKKPRKSKSQVELPELIPAPVMEA